MQILLYLLIIFAKITSYIIDNDIIIFSAQINDNKFILLSHNFIYIYDQIEISLFKSEYLYINDTFNYSYNQKESLIYFFIGNNLSINKCFLNNLKCDDIINDYHNDDIVINSDCSDFVLELQSKDNIIVIIYARNDEITAFLYYKDMNTISNLYIEKENKEIKGKVQCIERDDNDIRVLCIYIVQDNINIIEYEIDNDEIEKEKVKLINDSDNQKYITSKLESLNKNEIIICGITTGNKISCFILNNELLLMKYKEEIIINCDISMLEISIINEERFLVICENIANNSLLVKEENSNFNSPSKMMTIDISNHKIHYLKGYGPILIYSTEDSTVIYNEILIPKCLNHSINIIDDTNKDNINGEITINIGNLFLSNDNIDNNIIIDIICITYNNKTEIDNSLIQIKGTSLFSSNQYILSSLSFSFNITSLSFPLLLSYMLYSSPSYLSSSLCQVTLYNCYPSCNTCSSMGDSNENKCLSCISGYSLVQNSNCVPIQCYHSCSTCSMLGNDEEHKCIECKEQYFPLATHPSNCYYYKDILPHFYYNVSLEQFKECSNKCYTCYNKPFEDDSNCITCSEGYFPYPYDNSNCIKSCAPNYWYIEKDTKKVICTPTPACPEKAYPVYEMETNQCLPNCKDDYLYYKGECIEKCPQNTYEDTIKNRCYDVPDIISIEDIEDIITALPVNSIYHGDGFILHVYNSSSESTKNALLISQENNLTYIFFGDCINVLKMVWNIDEDIHLLIAKIDIIRTNQITNQLEYMVFDSLSGNKLDLSVCGNLNIKVSHPLLNTSGIDIELAYNLSMNGVDIYNTDDSFFNEFCLNYTSETNRDVVLKDRRNDYYKNVSFCEINCTYYKVDIQFLRVECVCPVKVELNNSINDNTYSSDFSDEVTHSNYEVIKCYNLVFNYYVWKRNYGNFIFIGLFGIEFLIFVHYLITGTKPVLKRINLLLKSSPPVKIGKRKGINNQESLYNTKETESNETQTQRNLLILNRNNNYIGDDFINNSNIYQLKKKKKTIRSQSTAISKIKSKKTLSSSTSSKIYSKFSQSEVINTNIEDYEEMQYEEAIKKDKRNFIQLYNQLIQNKHILICLFLEKNILFKPIRLSVFILGAMTDFFFNAFFYTDEYISKAYKLNSNLSFWAELPKSIISYFLTALFLYLLEYLSSSKIKLKAKKGKKKIVFFRECNALLKILKFKLGFYFTINFIFILFYWYYISAFCGLYQNSQVSWIKSTMISFGISILTPFAYCIAIAVIRKTSLEYKKKWLFKISNLIMILT